MAPLMALPVAIGAAQMAGGLISAANNKAPSLQPFEQNLRDAEGIARAARNRASFGYSPEFLAQATQQFQGAQSQSIAAARAMGLSGAQAQNASMMAAMQASQGMQGVAAQNELERARKQQEADAALAAIAPQRLALFDQQQQRYMQRAESANALIGAGMGNVMEGVMGQATLNQGKNYVDQTTAAYDRMNAPEVVLGQYMPGWYDKYLSESTASAVAPQQVMSLSPQLQNTSAGVRFGQPLTSSTVNQLMRQRAIERLLN